MSQRPPSDPRSPVQEGGRAGLLPALLIAGVGALIFWGSQQQWPSSEPPDGPPLIAERPSRSSTGARPAKARSNLASYFSGGDYPDAAIRNEEQGTAEFELRIDARGRVDQCTITSSSGSALLDSTTCRIMRSRARFSPARDASGQDVPDVVRSRIRWVIPDA